MINTNTNNIGFYENAFNSYYNELWANTKYHNEYRTLSYLHTLSIFISNNPITEIERRNLLLEFIKPYVKSDELLNSIKSTLSTDNTIINRILNTICNLYDNNVERKFNNLSDDMNIEFKNKLTQSSLNTALSQVYKISKMMGEVIIRPILFKEQLSYQIITADNYRASFDPGGNMTELSIHYPQDVNGTLTDQFQIWTNDEIKMVHQSGQTMSSETNELGKIPYLRLNVSTNFDYTNINSSLYWEMMKAQLNWNRTTTIQDNDSFISSFPITVLHNFGDQAKRDSIGPGKVFIVDIEGNGLNEPAQPHIEMVGPDASYSDLQELKIQELQQFLRANNLPEDMISGETGIMSGTAMKLSRLGLEEYRVMDKNIMSSFEKKFIQEIFDLFYVPNQLEIDIKYDIDSFPEDASKTFDLKKKQFDAGLISVVELYKETIDVNTTLSDEEILQKISDNKEYLVNNTEIEIPIE